MATSSVIFYVGITAGGGIITLVALAMLLWHRKRAQAPLDLINRIASVEVALEPEGTVLVGGEVWRACSRTGLHITRGSRNVRVVGASTHLLEVEPRG